LILAGISHDLRTPLTRLRMGIEMTGDDSLRDGMSADVEEMDKTIAQFLDFARTEGGEAEQAIDVGALVAELAAQYQRRNLAVVVSATLSAVPPAGRPSGRKRPEEAAPTLEVTARPQAIRRTITNLIDNALRYAPEQATEIGCTLNGKQVSITIRDHGPGIPPGEVERLKRPFTRLDTARGNALGAGLGLAIVDRIVKSHGGELLLEPADGGGLLARVNLPAL
jgi:two-component system osmolarity sensor histidine kinase EnvZ